MKHIKGYKNLNNNEPMEGDYVICEEDEYYPNYPIESVNTLIKNNIGRIITIEYSYINKNNDRYYITYDNIPEECDDYFSDIYNNGFKFKTRDMLREEIKYWSKNKKDLEIILQANKYNL